MRIHRLAIAAIALLILALAVGSASANRLSVSNRNFRLTWTGMTLEDEVFAIDCNVILEGSFHSATIRKIRRALIGFISRARATADPCEGDGEMYFLNGTEELQGRIVGNTLPWHVIYSAFIGTLPNIYMEVGIVGASILVELPLEDCLYRSTAEEPWYGIFERNFVNGRITGFRNNELQPIPLNAGFFCPEEIFPERTAGVSLLNATTSIILSLI